jgi:hypothetical protein
MVLAADHPAAVNGVPLHADLMRVPTTTDQVLKPGYDNDRSGLRGKLGKLIRKGPWRGYPIYSLMLPERLTCSRACPHWFDCYGNRIGHYGTEIRWLPGPELITALNVSLRLLSLKHRDGFAVRLHTLGDFHSVDYVAQWVEWLRQYPALHIFGMTHCHPGTPIGDTLLDAVNAH